MTRINIKLNLLVFALATFFITPGFTPAVSYSKSATPNFQDFTIQSRTVKRMYYVACMSPISWHCLLFNSLPMSLIMFPVMMGK